jgi:hypothetical protein
LVALDRFVNAFGRLPFSLGRAQGQPESVYPGLVPVLVVRSWFGVRQASGSGPILMINKG